MNQYRAQSKKFRNNTALYSLMYVAYELFSTYCEKHNPIIPIQFSFFGIVTSTQENSNNKNSAVIYYLQDDRKKWKESKFRGFISKKKNFMFENKIHRPHNSGWHIKISDIALV